MAGHLDERGRAQALGDVPARAGEKNAGKSGAIHKVMEQVRQMLDTLISRAKEGIGHRPGRPRRRKAKRLAGPKALPGRYFAHAERPWTTCGRQKKRRCPQDHRRSGKTREVRFSILKDKAGETYIKIDEDILK